MAGFLYHGVKLSFQRFLRVREIVICAFEAYLRVPTKHYDNQKHPPVPTGGCFRLLFFVFIFF